MGRKLSKTNKFDMELKLNAEVSKEILKQQGREHLLSDLELMTQLLSLQMLIFHWTSVKFDAVDHLRTSCKNHF